VCRGDCSRRRHPERALVRLRRVLQRDLTRQRRPRLVLGEHVDEVERMRRRRHVRKVELRHFRHGVEDRVELPAETLELLLGERDPRQPRDMKHLFPRNCH